MFGLLRFDLVNPRLARVPRRRSPLRRPRAKHPSRARRSPRRAVRTSPSPPRAAIQRYRLRRTVAVEPNFPVIRLGLLPEKAVAVGPSWCPRLGFLGKTQIESPLVRIQAWRAFPNRLVYGSG